MSTDRQAESSQTQPASNAALAQSIMESVADGVVAIDRDWTITAFNPAAEHITGVSSERAIGRKCFDVLKADVCDNNCPIRKAIATSKRTTGSRVTILNAEGDEVPVSISAAPLRNENGEIVGGVETFRDLSAEEQLRKELSESYTYHDIIGKNPRMRELFRILPAVAESESTVLIEGESGTGKELFARAVHDLSPRADGPYIIVNCSALPENLLESELFGYLKGAFTDAKKDKPGRFQLAQGGSIFLDEVGTLSPQVQIKLLRVIEQKVFEPLGSTQSIRADVRLIAATNKPLHELVAEGRFRDDLLYRLNVITLELPALRDRKDDIPLLADHFIHRFNVAKRRQIEGIRPEARQALLEHSFPGNVRELQNIIEHAFILCESGTINLRHMPRAIAQTVQPLSDSLPSDVNVSTDGTSPALAHAEAQTILAALRRNGGHRKLTADELGISTATLWRKMKRHGIREA